MSDLVPNPHQWPHTENANRGFHSLVMQYRPEELAEIFLKTPSFATEKLDGTNVAKDDTGQVYSRRLKIGPDESHFQKTPLSTVRSADISRFRDLLCLAGGLELESLSLDRHDFTFSLQVRGEAVPLATGGDCYSTAGCPRGGFRLSLAGTGLEVASDTDWLEEGHFTSSNITRDQVSSDPQLIRSDC